MDKNIDFIIKKYIRFVQSRKIFPEKVFLFGSFAKNKQDNNSDIDLALIFKNLPDKKRFDLQVQLFVLASEIDSRIEPHPFNLSDFNISHPVASEIIKTGIELKK
ncbi:MAG: nucleotidyltransferase domain-containing protein [Bacteroidetes bacterium]|nr:nucleotidyltransferase domain-containing protein [Bacteroidota bacterium]